jgi:hypothetical protein
VIESADVLLKGWTRQGKRGSSKSWSVSPRRLRVPHGFTCLKSIFATVPSFLLTCPFHRTPPIMLTAQTTKEPPQRNIWKTTRSGKRPDSFSGTTCSYRTRDATLTRDCVDLRGVKCRVKHMALSADGNTLATIISPRHGKSTLDFRDTRTGEIVHTSRSLR